jgi:tetratricopeptide (TPR) repeat protein
MRSARRRQQLACFWHRDGDLDEAVRHGRRALRLAQAALSAVSPAAMDPSGTRPEGFAPAVLAAETALTLALVERDRAAYTAGHEHLTYALGLLDEFPASADRDRLLARVLVALADAHRRAGRYAAVDATMARLRYLLAALPGETSAIAALTVEGIAAKERGLFDDAARCYAEVGRLLDEAGAPTAEIAALQHNLAGLAYAQERYVEAETHARRAVALRRAEPRTTPVDLAQDLAVLASALAGQGRYDEAIALFDEALTICRKARPPRHYEIAVQLHNLAAIYQALGEPARAEQLYRQALAIKEMLLGGEHPEVAVIADKLGTLIQDRSRRDGSPSPS